MSEIQLYLLAAERDRDEAQSITRRSASRLESNDVKLVEFVESLREYLNNDDASIRIRTVAYLADVLTALPKGVLSRQQRELLNNFILVRISNGAEAPGHSARALVALESLGRFDQQRVDAVLNAIFNHASPLVDFKQQSDRFEMLKLLDLLFSAYRKEIQTLRDETLLSRLLACLDGEKDPRNLMIIFSLLNVPMVEWDVSADAQDLFEAVFNYFPITFRPPPNDPYGITSLDLKDRLRDCISATASFAPYSFSALLDKLDSTSANVKRDALQALQACIRRYGPSTINLYAITLWDAVKFEILNSQEVDLAEEALRVLFEIGHSLSSTAHVRPLQNYLKSICKECNEHLEDTPTKQSSATGQILQAIAESSAESAATVVKGVFPQLLQFYQRADNIPRRRGLLEVAVKVIQANVSVFGHWRHDEPAKSHYRSGAIPPDHVSSLAVLGEISEQTLDALLATVETTSISEVSFRVLAIDGLEGLTLIRGLLDQPAITKVIKQLDSIIISEASHGRDEVKAKAIDVLVDVARQKPQMVLEEAFPAFMAELPDTDPEPSKHYVPILEAFAKLSAEPQVFNTVVIRLKSKLYAALRLKASTKYTESILSAILYAFQYTSLDSAAAARLAPYYSEVVTPLLKDIAAGGSEQLLQSATAPGPLVYDLIGRICNFILRPQPFPAQIEICQNTYTLFRASEPMSLPPFHDSSPRQGLTMITSTHILAALQVEAKPHADVSELLVALVDYALKPSLNHSTAISTVAQISLLVNKYASIPQLTTTTLGYLDETSYLLAAQSVTEKSLRVVFAMVKGLVLRADPKLKTILPRLLVHFTDPTKGTFTAQALAGLIAPDPFLTKENHCKIYSIYRQRFFSLITPLLVTSFRSVASSHAADKELSKSNYLVALSGIVQHVPYELLHTQLEDLIPLLVQSLTLQDVAAKASAIATLSKVVMHDSKMLESHVASLISRLLDVASLPTATEQRRTAPAPKYPQLTSATIGSQFSSTRPPKVRAAALACLGSFVGSLRDQCLVSYQRQTVSRLTAALDDSRRSVRAEAVRCRAAWLALAAEDDDDDF